jgi:hypothetical protein
MVVYYLILLKYYIIYFFYFIYKGADDLAVGSYHATQAGYGFACFIYLVAFLLLSFAAVCVSPFICGSFNERNVIRNPQELHLDEKADNKV